jgi:hypothetical protein
MAKNICTASFKDGSVGKDKDGKSYKKSYKKGDHYDGQYLEQAKKLGFVKVVEDPKPAAPKPAPAPAAGKPAEKKA